MSAVPERSGAGGTQEVDAGRADFLSRLSESTAVTGLLAAIQGEDAGDAPQEDTGPVEMQPIGALLRDMPWRGRASKRRRDVQRRRAEHIGDPWVVAVGDLFASMAWRGGVDADAASASEELVSRAVEPAHTVPGDPSREATTDRPSAATRRRAPRTANDIAW